MKTSSLVNTVTDKLDPLSSVAGLITGTTEFKESSIDSFISSIANGTQKSNYFHLSINYPEFMLKKFNATIDRKSILCESLTTPPINLITHIQTVNGLKERIPYSREQGEITLDFLNDGKMDINKYITTWNNSIIDPINLKTKLFRNDYVGDLIISLLDTKNQVIRKYKIVDSYPVNINAINYSSENSGEHTRTSVTFFYKYIIDEFLMTDILDELGKSGTIYGVSYDKYFDYFYDINDVAQNISKKSNLLKSNLKDITNTIF